MRAQQESESEVLGAASVASTRPIQPAQLGEREQWIRGRAIRCAIAQGYCQETAEAFAQWAQSYAPEIQGFHNLLDYFMSSMEPKPYNGFYDSRAVHAFQASTLPPSTKTN